ncbi:MAG TPA: DUF4097 family beta strand repeat-containing protein [Elusimicrobiota bacterium]|nr:DUF4097 family beta strand repeat-containing protein [Elusimicrobiota bacterium]
MSKKSFRQIGIAAALAALIPARARASELTKLFSGAPAPRTVAKEFPAAGLKTVSAQVAIGNISLRGVSGSAIAARISNDEPSDCAVTMAVEGSTLRLSARGTNRWFWQADRCRAKISVDVPAGAAVMASAGEGDVDASGLAAGANIHVGSGNILLKGVSGALMVHDGRGLVSGSVDSPQVDAAVGDGSVALTGLTGSAAVKVGNGNVRLAWAKAPKMGSAAVKSGHGDVVLEFPPGTTMHASLVSGLGRTVNEIGDAPGAPFSVSVSAGLGNVIIKKAGP